MSPQSHLSANKGDNEIIPEILHRSLGICLMTEEITGKIQLGDRLIKTVRPVITSNEFGRIVQHFRKKIIAGGKDRSKCIE